jgi:hypothetical protein
MKVCRSVLLTLALSALATSPSLVRADEPTPSKTTAKKVAVRKAVVKKEAAQPSLFTALFGGGDESAAKPSSETTFKEAKAIPVKSSFGSIVAIARGPEDTVVAIAGPARGVGSAAKSKKKGGAEVQMYTKDGELVRKFAVEFAATAAATTPSGELLLAGDGKIARFDAQGKQLACIDAPHVADLLKNEAAIKKQAEERKASMVKMYEQQVTMLKKQVEAQAKREKEGEGKGTIAATRNKAQYESMIKMYEQQVKQMNDRPLEQYVAEITGQVKTVNALAASKDYVFLTCGEAKGYGYTCWRMNADFSRPKPVLTGLSGCCGQMDVQCCDDCLLVAENTRKRVGVYSFDGKSLRSFGKDGRESVGEGFGSCCNPMNTFPADNGSILTAESEGFIKRFDKDGKYVELVAQAKLSGGCKNVAIATSKDGKRVFCMDLPGSRLLVFAPKAAPTVAAN